MFARTYKRIEPELGTATRRRELRARIRQSLGVSSQPAPGAESLFRAVEAMATLVGLTAPGYRLRLVGPGGVECDAERALSAIREEG